MRIPEKGGDQRPYMSTKAVALVLSLSALTGCGAYGKPVIVSGVPAQVDYKKEQAEYDPSNPPLWPEHYYFGLEQCQKDIRAAEAGKAVVHPSFDPAVHEHGPDCFVKQVDVPKEIYDRYAEGATIIFKGDVGKPIGQVN